MITMVLGGLWHGAAWTFVVWGALHGLGPGGRAPAPRQPGAPRAAARGRRAGAGLGAAVPDLPVRVPGLGVLQRVGDVPGLRPAGPPRSPAGASRRRWSRRSSSSSSSARSPCSSCPTLGVARLQAAFSRQHAARAGRHPRRRAARHHHLRPRRRGPVHLLPVLMRDADARHRTELAVPADGTPPRRRRVRRALDRRVLAIGVAGLRRVVPALRADPAAQRAGLARSARAGRSASTSWDRSPRSAARLQLSHIVSATGPRANGLPGGTDGLITVGPPAAARRRQATRPPRGRHRPPPRRRRSPPNPKIPTAADPLRVLIVGDSLGIDLGGPLQYDLADTGVVNAALDARESTGLTRPDYFNWPAELASDLKTAHPQVVVVMIGRQRRAGLPRARPTCPTRRRSGTPCTPSGWRSSCRSPRAAGPR